MSPVRPITQDRIYREIKAKIVSGEFGVAEKLEAPSLAKLFGTSVTPVREALFRLVGEEFVRTAPNGGFQIQPLTRASLKEMYSLTQALLLMSLSRASRDPLPVQSTPLRTVRVEETETPESIGAIFRSVFLLAGNRHIVEIGSRLIDRLAPVRHVEANVIGGTDAEQAMMLRLSQNSDFGGLRRAVYAYHRRRIVGAAQLLTELAMQSLD